jgi:very-short-patch-repair endonuclease
VGKPLREECREGGALSFPPLSRRLGGRLGERGPGGVRAGRGDLGLSSRYDLAVRIPNKDALVRAKRLREVSTPSEQALWAHLRGGQVLGLKFRRQAPIGPYIADFFCHELRLVLELDGSIHEEESQIAHDDNRDANLQALGYRILRFTNQDVRDDVESILEAIRRLYRNRTLSPLSRRAGGEAGREGSGE